MPAGGTRGEPGYLRTSWKLGSGSPTPYPPLAPSSRTATRTVWPGTTPSSLYLTVNKICLASAFPRCMSIWWLTAWSAPDGACTRSSWLLITCRFALPIVMEALAQSPIVPFRPGAIRVATNCALLLVSKLIRVEPSCCSQSQRGGGVSLRRPFTQSQSQAHTSQGHQGFSQCQQGVPQSRIVHFSRTHDHAIQLRTYSKMR